MSGRVSISRKTALALVVAAGPSCRDDPFYRRAYDELCSALKPKKSVQASRKRRAQKKTEHRAETSDVHAAVMMRAGGRCDNCRCESPLDLEHMFGRVKTPQSERNCWALCRGCHRAKTNGSAPWAWFRVFAILAEKRGFKREAATALRDADWLESKAEARERLGPGWSCHAEGMGLSMGEYCPTCGSRKTPTRGLVSGSVRIVLCDYLGCVLVVGSDLRPITKDEWLAMDGGDRNLILAAREQSVLPAPEKVA